MLVGVFLKSLVTVGTLRVIDANGKLHEFSGSPGPSVTVRLHDRSLHTRLFINPHLATGEAFMDGTLTIEDGDIYDFAALGMMNLGTGQGHWVQDIVAGFRRMSKRLAQYNPIGRAQANVAHHYDLSDALYELFLDKDRQYSCAYFQTPEDSLEEAQENKRRHIAAKLMLESDSRVLDIGSGWGGLALYLSQVSGADVTGITLSQEQLKVARERAAAAGLATKVRFNLQDYREVTGRFDSIVSVGMFEHVGVGYYLTFFNAVRDLLAEDGVGLLHSIGRMNGPGATSPWVHKYIFPGGYVPALSEVLPVIERAGLVVTDIEILRLHYAETLKAWRRNFNANRARVAELYDERFCRMWEFYLAGSEASFRYGGLMVFQIQMAKRHEAVPLTRDYITDWERSAQRRKSAAA